MDFDVNKIAIQTLHLAYISMLIQMWPYQLHRYSLEKAYYVEHKYVIIYIE